MRLNYYDFLRGIAILMVVAIHTGPAYHFESMQVYWLSWFGKC